MSIWSEDPSKWVAGKKKPAAAGASGGGSRLAAALTKPPSQWSGTDVHGKGSEGKKERDEPSRAGEYLEREWWRVLPPAAAATTVATLAIAGGAGLVTGGASVGATLAGGAVWHRYCESSRGDGWWALLSRRARRQRILARFRQRWDAACRKLHILNEHGEPLKLRGPARKRKKGQEEDLDLDRLGRVVAWVDLGSFDPDKLDGLRKTLAQWLGLGESLGYPEDLTFVEPTVDAMRYRLMRVPYRQLPDPSDLGIDHRPAPSQSTIRLGVGPEGDVLWHLDPTPGVVEYQPHLRINGATGTGKGYLLRYIINQAVRAGWIIYDVDGGSTFEHKQWATLPNVRYHEYEANNPASLAGFITMVGELFTIAAERKRLCHEAHEESWKDLPPEVRAKHPRILVALDECSILLAKGGDAEDELRKIFGADIGRAMRGMRKWGINWIICDQITFAGTFLAPGSLTQAERFVFLGNPPNRYKRMVADDTKGWPKVSAGYGRGVTGITGVPSSFSPLVVPTLKVKDVGVTIEDVLALAA